MKLIQRLRNLWKLSEWEPSSTEIEGIKEVGRTFSPITKAPKMAEIIKRSSPQDKFFYDTNERQ